MLTRRRFYHYADEKGENGTWYTCLINENKLQKLTTNRIHKKFKHFIYSIIIPEKVPNHFFTPDANRCYNLPEYECDILERPSRHKTIIEQALKNKKENQETHFVVQKALLESPETNFVVAELPVYLNYGERVGHVDLIELTEGNPSIIIFDLKPNLSISNEKWVGQVGLGYRIMLATMLQTPLREIMCGAFDHIKEELLVE